MSTISTSVVNVAISLATRAPIAANFGIPGIFADAPYTGGRLYELSQEGLASMVTDGFSALGRAYALASSMASQSPHAEQVMIFNRAALTTNTLEFTPLVTTLGTVYEFDITYKGVTSTISHTVSTATVDGIIDAIEILIDASAAGLAGITTTPDNATATKLSLIGGTTGEPVQVSGANPRLIKLLDVSADAGIATDLAAAALDPATSFYRFVIDSYSEAENNAAAAWAEANGNRFFAQSADSTNIVDSAGSGVGHDFFAAAYNRSVVVQSYDMNSNEAACLVGLAASQDPGTFGYAYKTLAGPAALPATATHLANALGKFVLVYGLDGGVSHTFTGKAASGRSLRIQDALDFLDQRIREAVLATFMSNSFIGMSDEGFALQEAAVRGVLASMAVPLPGKKDGIILKNYTVTVPKASTVSAADLTAGILRNLRFSCVMPNDMQKVLVNGTVSF